MTVHQTQSVQQGVEITVPLNRLKHSPRNARRTRHRPDDIAALAASIAAKGVLQPPVVEAERDGEGRETGTYLVTIGEGRRQALKLLAKQKKIARDAPVRCLLDEANDAFEISLDENVTRFAMHPADQFEAFRRLNQTKGWSAEEIAARFGVTPTLVRQRLRLAAVSPALMAAYRAEDLGLDQLMAFAVSEDHARQEQVYRDLSYNRSPSLIRRLMTEHEVSADDRRARFVGVEVYQAAGGSVRHDLFSEDGGGWFEDAGLLDRLALEKLAAEAEAVRAAEGWLWAEASLDYPHGPGLGRIYPRAPQHDPDTETRLAALAEEYDAIVGVCGDEGPSEAEEARLVEIDAELRAASTPVYEAEAVARAGLYVILGHEGRPRIERGFVRPEDASPSEATGSTDQAEATEAALPAGPKPLADRVIADLTAHRTMALRDRVGSQPQVALLAALHALVLQAFDYGSSHTCLELAATGTPLDGWAEGLADSTAGRAVEARHAAWAARLPKDAEDVLGALEGLDEAGRLDLFAHCVSLTVHAVRTVRSSRAVAHADDLARLTGLAMQDYWRPTAVSYFGRITKAQMLDAVAEAVSPEAASGLETLKKDAMAEAAAGLVEPTGWLPPLLRSPEVCA